MLRLGSIACLSFSLMPLLCASLCADPIIAWNGLPVVVGYDVTANETADGIDIQASCSSSGTVCISDLDVYTSFSVSSAGTFLLSTSVSFSGNASNCFPDGPCQPSAFLDASLEGLVIIGSDYPIS
jgi:hypothetical protein